MSEQPAVPETPLEKKRRETRERVRAFRDRQKEKEGRSSAQLAEVDCPIEITIKEAHRILEEECGLRNRHAIAVVYSLLRHAAEEFRLPVNYHLIRWGIQQTRLELLTKQLLREKFLSKELTEKEFKEASDGFEAFIHGQLPDIYASASAAGLSPQEWLKQQQDEQHNPAF